MKLKLIYLEWQDATSKSHGWCTLEDVKEWGKKSGMIIKEVGWVIEENDKYILLADKQTVLTSHDKENKIDTYYGEIIKIPTTWIKKRKIIKI